ncbi:hypothetical protein MY3296_005805 [Beauveria thailandica]
MPGPAFLSQQDAAGEKLGPPQKQQNAGAKLLVITYGKGSCSSCGGRTQCVHKLAGFAQLWLAHIDSDIRGAAYPAEKKKQ